MMKKATRIFTIILLIFTGISAVGGGFLLISDPTGKSLQFPQEAAEALQNSVFGNFLIPGIALFLFIGVAAFIVAFLMIRKSSYYPSGLMYMGAALLIWLTIQVITVKMFSFLQLLYLVLAILFLSVGMVNKRVSL
jgi:hypothetical protein